MKITERHTACTWFASVESTNMHQDIARFKNRNETRYSTIRVALNNEEVNQGTKETLGCIHRRNSTFVAVYHSAKRRDMEGQKWRGGERCSEVCSVHKRYNAWLGDVIHAMHFVLLTLLAPSKHTGHCQDNFCEPWLLMLPLLDFDCPLEPLWIARRLKMRNEISNLHAGGT